MRNEFLPKNYSLKDLTPDYFLEIGIPKKVVTDTFKVINAFLDQTLKPEDNLKTLQNLHTTLQGKNAMYRMPIVYCFAGASEIKKEEINGCGPAWFPVSLPSGPWDECCNDHDRCYNDGGSFSDRLKCDYLFYKCLNDAGLPIIAEIFGVLVVSFGWFSFDWGGNEDETENDTPKPTVCTGTCEGVEYHVSNLYHFQTVDRHLNVLVNEASQFGMRALGSKAIQMSEILYSRRCSKKCKCRFTDWTEWNEKPTTLIVPGNDPNSGVQFTCRATMKKREVKGDCVH